MIKKLYNKIRQCFAFTNYNIFQIGNISICCLVESSYSFSAIITFWTAYFLNQKQYIFHSLPEIEQKLHRFCIGDKYKNKVHNKWKILYIQSENLFMKNKIK